MIQSAIMNKIHDLESQLEKVNKDQLELIDKWLRIEELKSGKSKEDE